MSLTVGDRISQLERTFRAKGKTQKDLAASLGVSARTVRRWKKSEVEAPRSETPAGGRKVSEKLESRFRKLDYSKLRRRERYHFHEAPAEPSRREGPPPEELDRPDPQLSEAERALMDRPVFFLDRDATRNLMDREELMDAIANGERVTFTLQYSRSGDRRTAAFTMDFVPGLDPAVQLGDLLSRLWHESRLLFAETDSNWAGSIVAAHAGG